MNLPDGSSLELIGEAAHPSGRPARDPDHRRRRSSKTPCRPSAKAATITSSKAGDYLFAIPLMVEKNMAIWQTKQENRRLQDQLHALHTR